MEMGKMFPSHDNKHIVVEDGFELQIGVAKTSFKNLEKVGDNTYKALVIDEKTVSKVELESLKAEIKIVQERIVRLEDWFYDRRG